MATKALKIDVFDHNTVVWCHCPRKPANIRTKYTLAETRVPGLHFMAHGIRQSPFEFAWWALKYTYITHLWPFSVIQGRRFRYRSKERICDFLLMTTLVLSCTVSEIRRLCRKSHLYIYNFVQKISSKSVQNFWVIRQTYKQTQVKT